jgi:hypothetical protein
MKISHSENDQPKNKLAFNALKKLIATTRFHRFEVLAESYVI